MQPLLVCLFYIMQPPSHPPIPNTVIVPVSENTLAPIVVHVLCIILVVWYLILGEDNFFITF